LPRETDRRPERTTGQTTIKVDGNGGNENLKGCPEMDRTEQGKG